MRPSTPASHTPTSQVFWLAQSTSVRPARRRAPDMAGLAVTLVSAGLLLLVATLGNLG